MPSITVDLELLLRGLLFGGRVILVGLINSEQIQRENFVGKGEQRGSAQS